MPQSKPARPQRPDWPDGGAQPAYALQAGLDAGGQHRRRGRREGIRPLLTLLTLLHHSWRKYRYYIRFQAEASDRYLNLMESLREALNRGLFLGLEDFECHFALYPPGAFYRKHVDRFRDDDRRMVSVVVYLNEGWLPEDGGQLRMYLDEERVHDVQPTGGCLVVFLSGEVPHEVLPANRERLSLTGWFRRRGNEPF